MMVFVSGGLLVAGAFFFLAGTVGLLRFPDIYCRLHALTKADNLGLGLIVLGLGVQPMEWTGRFQLLLIWLAALAAAATVCHILARWSLRRGVEPVTGASGTRPAGASSSDPPGSPAPPEPGRDPRPPPRREGHEQ